MIVFLKKQMFAFDHSYDLLDEREELILTAKRDPEQIENCVSLYNQKGRVIASVTEFTEGKQPTYQIFLQNRHEATLFQEVSWKRKEFLVERDDLRYMVENNFISTDFDIKQDGSLVFTAKKDSQPWRETFRLTLSKEEDLQLFLCILLVSINIYEEEW